MPVVKPYTLPELRTFVETEAARLIGGQLQDVLANDRGLALGFWLKGHHWLIIDLRPNAPLALVFDGERGPFVKGKKPKPVSLFLKSHAHNRLLRGVTLREEFGRVMRLDFGEGCEVDVQLIPKQENMIVRAAGKQVAWEKPKELTPPPPAEFPAPRSMEAIRDEWLAEQKGDRKPAQDPEAQWRKQRDRDLEKKRKALIEIEKQLSVDAAADWYARGDALKAGAGEPIDSKKSRSWNIEQAYAKAKQAAAKKVGAGQRAVLLRAEIEALEAAEFSPAAVRGERRPAGADVMRKAEARGRTLALSDGVTAFMGKSAADNMALLRKSRAWDYWMHLRDYPGAHAIVHRQRDQAVSDADLRKAAQWLAKESKAGGRVVVVIAECRHVRPIKGDRLGRVNYRQERQFTV